ncbi:proline dehydrogenase [Cytobacillus horneckiae]|uniref:proline dehydrogenase n=1 Tax=Cytobacillus horneckiae TaxID=549687 RepID=A0A2N0ZGE6_9BACI|nr:proline dehydrogenase family protein [Cytobacillus horneckiae]NRG44770.1 proline dehydrogenase family protein [Bacillus sp. CRN 9]MBN6888230.1 proline dehydrogenase family protein [Cytobacillus horneckiae]MCM3177086.1 proline dehydrogenase family protein [Cytobacillus horneckiae]MEC1154785.1 proline dehydrogenase family protein [Cytobacillus horneckiae]MED2940279.1 proline dehydrogenase family protein [Cytobacillus horneckiae]
MLKDLFIGLSKNQFLNSAAKKYGLKLGAQSVVAGTNIEEAINSIKELNAHGISCTVDNLGEFVNKKEDATAAKEQIIAVVEAIHESNVDAHISLKPSQLGLDIDYSFCLDNLKEIVGKAYEYGIFINFDMEDHARLQPSFDLLDELSKEYDNIGTVIQAYFYRAAEDIEKYKNYRLRIVKGAYKEPADVAYISKEEIDKNYIKLIEYHLLNGKFTSIATHDHNVINHVKRFVKQHDIPNEKFEFQMLYGFRKEMQFELAKEGYNFTTYIPFGDDWYGYYMRRLAERPQNLNLVVKQVFNKKTNTFIGVAAGAFLLGRLTKKNKEDK